MNYPIALHKDTHSAYGVTVPDLPGCYSAGASLEEAVVMAEEAIQCHLEGLLRDGDPIPQPRALEEHQLNPDFQKAAWGLILVDPSKIFGVLLPNNG
ncbi:MAG: type II toxin-antitoxin system HicB family antitoxin [Magnetococcales bacterium]|nr:type II toxin-antitoxin system HicB family antitoxin [Magnetococcales bacterium]